MSAPVRPQGPLRRREAVPVAPRSTARTYSHLAGAQRVPSEYAIATSRLHYSAGRALEIDLPLGRFFAEHRDGSPLALDPGAWEGFADPRATTYTRYVGIQSRQEAHVDQILDRIDDGEADRGLPAEALRFHEEALAPLRYPLHGLQMLAAYVGHMAPGGRLVAAYGFQAGDELRRVQRLAQRLGQLRRAHPGLGDDARARWERDAAWQPLREVIERMLVVRDWGESFTALGLCLKPLLDPMVHEVLGAEARARGDHAVDDVFASLDLDARWHRDVAVAAARVALAHTPGTRAALAGWIARWLPRSARAVVALGRAHAPARRAAGASLVERWSRLNASLELPAPPTGALVELSSW